MPTNFIYGIAMNTSDYGPNPYSTNPATQASDAACQATEAGCPYDSLNIGTDPDTTPQHRIRRDPGSGLLELGHRGELLRRRSRW